VSDVVSLPCIPYQEVLPYQERKEYPRCWILPLPFRTDERRVTEHCLMIEAVPDRWPGSVTHQPAIPQSVSIHRISEDLQEHGDEPELDVPQEAVQAVQEPSTRQSDWGHPYFHAGVPQVELDWCRVRCPVHMGHVPPAEEGLWVCGCAAGVDHQGFWACWALQERQHHMCASNFIKCMYETGSKTLDKWLVC
jgi:hypothetical protein